MTYLLDSNILLAYIRETGLAENLSRRFGLFSPPNVTAISVVSLGELRSLAIQNRWGHQKMALLNEFSTKVVVADIHVESIIDRYAEIDAFSQNRLEGQPLHLTPRNLGKNDLWIAATASVLEAALITTDHDFSHLNQVFLDLHLVDKNAI